MDEFAMLWCDHCEEYQKSMSEPAIHCYSCSVCGKILSAFNKSDRLIRKTNKSKSPSSESNCEALECLNKENKNKQRTSKIGECETDEESEDSVVSNAEELINVNDDNYKEGDDDDSSDEDDYSGFEEDDDDESMDKKLCDK